MRWWPADIFDKFFEQLAGISDKRAQRFFKICKIYSKFVMKRGDKYSKEILAKSKEFQETVRIWVFKRIQGAFVGKLSTYQKIFKISSKQSD